MDRFPWRGSGPLPALSARQWAVDAAVAAAVAATQAGSTALAAGHHGYPATPAGLALQAAGGAVLLARRRFPVAVLAASYITVFAYLATQQNTSNAEWLATIIAFCTAIYLRKRAAAIGFLVACYVASLLTPVLAGRPGPSPMSALSLGAGLALLLGAAELIRLRGQRTAALKQQREEEALRRASEERLRIARDLHDVVAHNISVINVQANTALHLMDRQPDRARSALTTISEVSKQALVEVRSVLGVLREVDEHAPRAPSASLTRLRDLIENAGAAGVSVHIDQAGERRPLPGAADVAAYRILQEALTNCARHSPGTNVMVRICYEEDDLIIEVDDDGPGLHGSAAGGRPGAAAGGAWPGAGAGGRPGSGGDGSGNGIIGMTERAHALGGTLEAGPWPDGGFRVRACLPLDGGRLLNGNRPLGQAGPAGGTTASRGGTASGGGVPSRRSTASRGGTP
jgi:signal transduction histidine kinase